MSASLHPVARRYVVRGRVQGVGFRAFVQRRADEIGVKGWVRNTAGGDVEVLAVGTATQLKQLADCLHQGPMISLVRSVEETEAAPERTAGFHIR